jgi:DNA mismatch repair protein MutL
MARTIHVLPDTVANQIAAGEVVERPASVVKELVENALDAGASRIEVRIEGGGKRRIRVADDGVGMGREDALLALDRHATSKIRSADDLRGVGTFGFRGEALPSIASVSRFLLETRAGWEEVGTRVRATGGRITSVEDAARTAGTTVSVEGLFFNAPARARFLGAPPAETRAVSEILVPLALANPHVAFELHSDDRPLLELPSASALMDRLAGLWGEEATGSMIPIALDRDGMRMTGAIQRPDAARPGFRRAVLFAGGRPFREAALLKAVDRGYRTTIPEDHRPWAVLFLEVPPGAVDVNVHPTKAEVRFRDRPGIERLVEDGVRQALAGEASAASFADPARRAGDGSGPDGEDGAAAGRDTAAGASALVRERARPSGPPPRAGSRDGGPAPPPVEEPQMALFLRGDAPPGEGETAAAPGVDGGFPETSAEGAPHADPGVMAEGLPSLGSPRLWQVHRAWILAEVRDGLLLIDQHAAHERVLFERMMARFDGEEGTSQRLLFPLTVRLTRAEHDLVLDLKGLLGRIGFEVEGFGGDSVIVHAVPNPHPRFDAERCFREMIDELAHGSELTRSARSQHERVAMSFACKAAIKAGQELDEREMQELFDQLFDTGLPFHDVHGRPTTVRLSRAELERKFGR